jgi:hypothetical protein
MSIPIFMSGQIPLEGIPLHGFYLILFHLKLFNQKDDMNRGCIEKNKLDFSILGICETSSIIQP